MNYLAIHIDTDFLVGTICADENTQSHPIKNGNEDLLWLYFYNDPYQNMVSFGKENQKHCSNGEINYYGNFIELIEREDNTFYIGEYNYPIIELLRHSKLLEKLKKTFAEKTLESSKDIPTLITFSLSVSELAKQKLVEYLNYQGFKIISYTIPLSELACFYVHSNNIVNFANGNIIVFLEATNSNLHLMKLMFSTNYFLLDGKPESKEGLGIDPRKRALLKYVVNKIGTMGVLSEQEKEIEYKIMESKTDEWLHRLDIQTNNCPVDVNEALSKMPNAKKRVLLYKDKIAEFTGSDIQLILDTYRNYISRNVRQDVAAIFLLGNCFQNDIIKTKFKNLIGADKLFFNSNKDIQDILGMYPKIDISRYAGEEARIMERAKAEELKQAEQRALEDRQRKEQEAAAEKFAVEQKTEESRKEAKKLFERAVEFEKEEKLEVARANIENAILLDKINKEYKQFFDDLKDKIKKRNEKNELYNSYLSNADNLLKSGDYENALEEYEAAKIVFDNAEIIEKIIEIKRLIKNKEKQKLKITQLVSDAKGLIQQKDFQNAKSKINEILSTDNTNADANILLSEIDQIFKQQENQFNDFVKSADKFFNSENYNEATNGYNKALILNPDSSYCMLQLEKINENVHLQKVNKEKYEKITATANILFESGKWAEAQAQYKIALNLYPHENTLQSKIKSCAEKIKALEDTIKGLIADAIFAKKEGKLKEALSLYEKALNMRPNDEDLKRRINIIKFNLQFESSVGNSKPTQKETNKVPKIEDNFLGNNKTTEKPKSINTNDFLGEKSNKTVPIRKEENDFIVKKPKKTIDDFDDFLGKEKR